MAKIPSEGTACPTRDNYPADRHIFFHPDFIANKLAYTVGTGISPARHADIIVYIKLRVRGL